jgi:preprotein translocase subunit SecD
MNNLRWRILLTVVIVGACLWAIVPPSQKIRLGLDLKGGVHLVLRVQTDDALSLETSTAADRAREAIEKAGVAAATVKQLSPTQFEISGISPDKDAAVKQATTELLTTFDTNAGVGTLTFTIKPNRQVQLREDAVVQAQQTIERRVNELGVAEPVVARQGGSSGEQMIVELPGVTDVARAKEIIRSTALLELKLVEQGPAATREALLAATNGQVPPQSDVVPGSESDQAGGAATTVYYLVHKTPVVTGRDLRNAKPSLDEYNQPAVSFSLNNEGARKFGKATGENIGRQLAIILDGRVQSAPRIDSRITDEGRISGGSFTQQYAQDLSLILRSGALPARLTYLQEQVIGPSLGADSIRAGIVASTVSLALVLVFMVLYYRMAGINAIVALVFNLIILLGAMSYIGATMTLPGVAGFVLSMGMGVDSNVLIFERIKEELAAQRGVRASINAGFSRVFLTLLDTHFTALISAAFLFQFGTGPIRGFATTLTFGLISNLFTATFVSKTLFEMVLAKRQVQTLSI